MDSSRPDNHAIWMNPPAENSAGKNLLNDEHTESHSKDPENANPRPKKTLKNVEVFDVTRDKKYIATVDSGLMLHVYEIKGKFEAYEELPVFKIYNSKEDEEEEHCNSSQTYSGSSDKGIWICRNEDSTLPPVFYVSLSISFDGKFIAVSMSSLYESRASYNIYSIDKKEKQRDISKSLGREAEELKASRHLRPIFMDNIFIIATNNSISIFDLKFDKISSTKKCFDNPDACRTFIEINATCKLIPSTDVITKMTEEQRAKLNLNEFHDTRTIDYMTAFIKQNILMEQCENTMDRLWLPQSNKLLASIIKNDSGDIVAISEDNKYIATCYIFGSPIISIYSLLTGLLLYRIKIGKTFFRIQYASFQFNSKYILLFGCIIAPLSEVTDSFYQLWDIPAQRLVYHKEYKLRTNKMRNPLIFIEPGPSSTDQLSVTYINSNNNDELMSESFDITIRDTMVDENQPASSIFEWKDWNPIGDPEKHLKEQPLEPTNNDAIYDLDSTKHNCKRYVLDYKSNKYVLIFGYYSVQMYRLKSIVGTSTDDSDVLKSAVGSGTDIKYYRFTDDNELIYIKIYNKELAELNRLLDGEELDAINPNDIQVKFDADGIPGRTLVTRKRRTNTSEATEYFDEMFLPMELITQNQPNTDIFEQSEKDNNRNSNDSKDPQTTENDSNTNIQREPEPVNEANTLPTKNNEDTNNNTQNESESTHEGSTVSTQNSENANNNTQNEPEDYIPPPPSNLEVQFEGEELPKKEYNGLEFHYFESTILTLYYFGSIMERKYKFDDEIIYDLTDKLLAKLIKKYDNTKYFSSEAGSLSLYLLSKIPSLHYVIQNILLKQDENQVKAKDQVPLSILSYPETDNILSYEDYTSVDIHSKDDNKKKMNVFTELSKTNHNLFYLLFYRVLMDSRSHGVGNMYAVTDLFLFLQREKFLDILLRCTEMTAYFPVPIMFRYHQRGILKKAFNSTFSIQSKTSVLSPALTEEMEMRTLYESKTHFTIFTLWKNTVSNTFMKLLTKISGAFKEGGRIKYNEPLFFTGEFTSETRTLCVVPFPDFLLHTPIIQTSGLSNILSILQHADSPFTEIASSKTFNNIFVESNVNIEVLTLYKWRAFAGKRFILILFVHVVYYIAFSVGVAFAEEVFGYQLGQTVSHPGHYVTIAIMFLSWLVLFVQEIRQFVYNIAAYMNLYNLIDWTALIMPIASFGLLLTNGKYIDEVTSTTTLVLWIHGILRLRAYKTFGTTLELITQMSLKTLPFIGAFLSVVIAFTHTLIVLLRKKKDEFFQEQFSGTLEDPQRGNLNGIEIIINDNSSQNDFKNPFKAFSDVWFFIYGVWDPLNDGDAGDSPMVTIFSILFSFVIGLIFFNMIIALMSSTIDKINERGKKNWIHHLAAVVSEVELFWSTPSERFDGVNNPRFVFYIADRKSYEDHKNKLSNDYKKYLQLYRQYDIAGRFPIPDVF